jgi:hypothetical protein
MIDPHDPAHVGPLTREALRTPRAAAVAGIAFAVLLLTVLLVVRLAIPADADDAGDWLDDDGRRTAVIFALNLVPFAGIAFLWFIGVVRDRIGAGEDRLFATVFLGSGLLFIAMMFAGGAVAGGLMLTGESRPTGGVWSFGRRATHTLFHVYAMRMAAVFAISTTMIASRLGLAPRWLTVLGLSTGLILMLAVGVFPWVELLFPTWVLALSLHMLMVSLRAGSSASGLSPVTRR